MNPITSNVFYFSREDWDADPQYVRLGGPEVGRPLIPPEARLYNIVHHTVGVDSDQTKNVWETFNEIAAMMRRLQVIRVDLGLDVPYNFVLFLLENGKIFVCEGRGYNRSGAHTAGVDAQGRYFNVAGYATSFAGDFENVQTNLTPWMPAINQWMGHLKTYAPNLGNMTVCGQSTCGHKDFAPFSRRNQTACPGQYLYAVLPHIRFEIPNEEEDMAVVGQFAVLKPGGGWDDSYVVTAGKEGARKTLVPNGEEYESLLAAGYPVRGISIEQLRKIISSPGTPEP